MMKKKMFPIIFFSKRSSNYVQSEPNKNERKKNRSNANYIVDVAKTHAHSFSTHLYVHSRDLIAFTIYKAVQKRRNNTAESNFFSSYFFIAQRDKRIYVYTKLSREKESKCFSPCFESRKIGFIGFYFVIHNSHISYVSCHCRQHQQHQKKRRKSLKIKYFVFSHLILCL